MPTRPRAQPASAVLVWTAILILYVVWGSTYLGIRVAIGTIPPFVMAAIRFAIAGAVMLGAVALVKRGRVVRPSARELRDCFIIGALLMGGGMGTVAWGELTVPSGIAGVLIAMMPVWVAVLGRAFFGERLPPMAIVGVATGMAGVAILVGSGVALDHSLDAAGVAALIFSPIAWSAGSLFSAHRARLPRDPFLTTGLQMLSGSAVLAVVALASGEVAAFRPELITTDSLIALVYLTAIGSLVAFTAYAWVLRQAPLPLIATYAFVNPVVAVFLGWLILNETVTPIQLVAGAVIVIGVALLIVSRNRMQAPRPAVRPAVAALDDDAVAVA
ncbi:MAG TPA: EamA family transporter [Candidatus Deferrimicrobium sp.]|nr:EamA family transporter [Candidatus Deferrimicrobium sp.]